VRRHDAEDDRPNSRIWCGLSRHPGRSPNPSLKVSARFVAGPPPDGTARGVGLPKHSEKEVREMVGKGEGGVRKAVTHGVANFAYLLDHHDMLLKIVKTE
jgi:hypothetical protein